ncbi:MAG: hypothetical protein ACR2G4_01455 [Pyrinomonadaceae bacterium]
MTADDRRVRDSQRIDEATRTLVRKLLLERIPLRGICRTLSISLQWLLRFITEVYDVDSTCKCNFAGGR